MQNWPADCAVLLLDAFLPEERPTVLRRAAGHAAHIWIMRLVVKRRDGNQGPSTTG